MGWSVGSWEIWSQLRSVAQMKLSVVPESINTVLSAVGCADLNKTLIHIDQYLLVYMLSFLALALAAELRPSENPS